MIRYWLGMMMILAAGALFVTATTFKWHQPEVGEIGLSLLGLGIFIGLTGLVWR